MKRLFQRLRNDSYRSFSDDSLRMQIQYRWAMKILLVFVLFMAVMNVASSNFRMAIILTAFGLLYYVCYWIVYKLKDRGVLITTIILNIQVFVFCHHIIIYGTNDGVAVLWITLLPVIVVLLTGHLAGIISSLLMFLMFAFYF